MGNFFMLILLACYANGLDGSSIFFFRNLYSAFFFLRSLGGKYFFGSGNQRSDLSFSLTFVFNLSLVVSLSIQGLSCMCLWHAFLTSSSMLYFREMGLFTWK